jgi:hypothetical protein
MIDIHIIIHKKRRTFFIKISLVQFKFVFFRYLIKFEIEFHGRYTNVFQLKFKIEHIDTSHGDNPSPFHFICLMIYKSKGIVDCCSMKTFLSFHTIDVQHAKHS